MVQRARIAAVHIVEADRVPAVGCLRLTTRQIWKQWHCEDFDADLIRTEERRRRLVDAMQRLAGDLKARGRRDHDGDALPV